MVNSKELIKMAFLMEEEWKDIFLMKTILMKVDIIYSLHIEVIFIIEVAALSRGSIRLIIIIRGYSWKEVYSVTKDLDPSPIAPSGTKMILTKNQHYAVIIQDISEEETVMHTKVKALEDLSDEDNLEEDLFEEYQSEEYLSQEEDLELLELEISTLRKRRMT